MSRYFRIIIIAFFHIVVVIVDIVDIVDVVVQVALVFIDTVLRRVFWKTRVFKIVVGIDFFLLIPHDL